MNKPQNQTLKMFQLTSDFLNESDPLLLNNLPNFHAYKDEFNLNTNKLRTQHDIQTRNITGYTIEKKGIQNDLIDKALNISNRIEAYAMNNGNNELKKDMHFTISDFKRFNENECLANCNNIYDKATELATALVSYGVTTALLTQMHDSITSFASKMDSSQQQINITKLATSEIAALFNTNMQLLNVMDVLVKMAKSANPDFVKGYFESRNMDLPAQRQFSIRLTIVDSHQAPIPSVLVTNDELRIRRRCSLKGIMLLRNINEGVYNFTFTKMGYTTQTKSIYVQYNSRTDERVVMD